MSKIYDKAFKAGVWFNILLFGFSNVVSFWLAYREYAIMQPKFAPASFDWGFPFKWDKNNFGITGDGVFLSGLIIAFCGFLRGFLFKFIWAKKRDVSML